MEALADVELMWHERIEQKARSDEKQQMIFRLLQRKFGTVPKAIVEKIKAINEPIALDKLFDQAVMAESLAEIEILV
ncbi:MAG: DUF4351 domain-containing protein [Chloroflexi bacterium]|nr:DUF4351 domain-containing protein [Chloroflexota bacterium]